LVLSGGVYAAATGLQRAVTFLLLPLYTRVLAPAEYGRLAIALSIFAVASFLLEFGLELAIYRNLFQLADNPEKRERFIQSVWSFLLVAPSIAAAVFALLIVPILGLHGVITIPQLGLSLLAAAISASATTVPFTIFRSEQRLREFLMLVAISTVCSTVLTLVLVVLLHEGPNGWLLALVVSYSLTLIVAVRKVPYKRPRPYDGKLVKQALRLSLPVIPHFTAMWALQLADRLLLAALTTIGAVGIYSLGSNLAMPMALLVIGFNQGFMPSYARAGTTANPSSELAPLIVVQVAIVAILCVSGCLLAPPIVHIATDVRYGKAADLVGWIILGYAFLGLYSIPMNGVTLAAGKTKRIYLISIPAAAANLALIAIFVPSFGIEAAAIASAAGYAVLLAGVALYAKLAGGALRYPWRHIITTLGVALVGYLVVNFTIGSTSVMDLLLRSAWTLVISVLVAYMAGVTPQMVLNRIRLTLAN
jgi:O-antigen/teichoic acid export membrane protein